MYIFCSREHNHSYDETKQKAKNSLDFLGLVTNMRILLTLFSIVSVAMYEYIVIFSTGGVYMVVFSLYM